MAQRDMMAELLLDVEKQQRRMKAATRDMPPEKVASFVANELTGTVMSFLRDVTRNTIEVRDYAVQNFGVQDMFLGEVKESIEGLESRVDDISPPFGAEDKAAVLLALEGARELVKSLVEGHLPPSKEKLRSIAEKLDGAITIMESIDVSEDEEVEDSEEEGEDNDGTPAEQPS